MYFQTFPTLVQLLTVSATDSTKGKVQHEIFNDFQLKGKSEESVNKHQ